jgi:hypothetical protein
MPIKPFEPKFMKVSILTAALQELTPREVRDPDPDRAIEEWVEYARQLGAGYIQLSAALHPTETDVPPEAMLDPVANTLDLRKPFDNDRAKRVEASLKANQVGITDIGYFDNYLHDDPVIRKKKYDFAIRVFDTPCCSASRPSADSLAGIKHSMDEPHRLRAALRPLLKAARGDLTYYVEQCPMPGWTTGDLPQQHRLRARDVDRAAPVGGKAWRGRPVPHLLRSVHAILMGQDTRSIFNI